MSSYLETESIVLRQIHETNLDNLFDLDNGPEAMRYLGGGEPTPRDLIETSILPMMISYYEHDQRFGFWAAIERSTGDFLGGSSLRPVSPDSTDQVELGYRLRRASWSHGYTAEVGKALIRKSLTDLSVQRVIATTCEENVGSRRVMEKLGMNLRRRLRFVSDECQGAGTLNVNSPAIFDGDDVEYALEKADWMHRQALQTESASASAKSR